MSEIEGRLDRPNGESLAFRRIEGDGPTVVWLGGFNSDMSGTKAQTLADWAAAASRAFVRFDYFGHGASSGDFAQGTITRWRADALAVIDELVEGPATLVGSSMGGWLACLAALARPNRVAALVLLAPAADFTDKLIWPALSAAARDQIQGDGVWMRPSAYGEAPTPITRELIEDGARWSILGAPVGLRTPVRVLQGGRDEDVPWRHALELFQAIESEQAVFTLIKDGDHRLSRPADLKRLVETVAQVS